MWETASQLSFGWYTAAILAVAGVAAASGLQFLVIGTWRYRERMHIAYALLCLCIGMLGLGNAVFNAAQSLPVAIGALRLMCFAAAASFPAFVVFIGAYTGRPVALLPVALVSTLALVFLWINHTAPATMLFHDLAARDRIALPWGESLFSVGGRPSHWGTAFHLLTYAAFLWALGRAYGQYRSGPRLRATLLGVCLLIQLGGLLWGDVIVDGLGYPYPYIDTFSFLPFVLLMGLSLGIQLHLRTRQLERTTRKLRHEAETRREAELSLRHVAYHDALTGLPNRLRALDHLAHLESEARSRRLRGAALMIDLDNFKTINDALSHHIGDRMLEAIADRLLLAAPAESMVARLGGDEFIVLLGGLEGDLQQVNTLVEQLASQILVRLSAPITVDSRVLAIGASVGVAVFPSGDADVSDVIRRADIALYRAKASGRNAVRLFLPHMQSEANDRLSLERGLRTALERNELGKQFSLHFQPQIDRHGQLQGAEALLRWHHPQLGPITPDVFIPVAEETGLIHALGSWVVTEACARINEWDRLGVDFGRHLSVNVSAWQLGHPQYVETLQAQVTEAGIAPSRLTLELTESALLQGFEIALDTLHRLHRAGFRLSMDDFGTGYSSLSYLQKLPLDELKIDRSFVSGLDQPLPSPLTAFIIDLGQRLGMSTVAEGVESEEQRAVLARLGCDVLQGYLVCRPLPEAEFLHWLGERTPAELPLRATHPN